MAIPVEDLFKIVEAFVAGTLLGLERESRNKPAGLRTLILITVGSTLFSILSYSLLSNSPDRVASNIVTGVGFVGAGVIYKGGYNLSGITTAATIWAAAAIGMGIGFGNYWLAGGTLLIVMITLTMLPRLEQRFDTAYLRKSYKITFDINKFSLFELEKKFNDMEVHFSERKMKRLHNDLTVIYIVNSNNTDLKMLDEFLMTSPMIKSFEV